MKQAKARPVPASPRRPRKARPSFGVQKSARTKKIFIPVPFSGGLYLSLRKFRTSKARRSKSYKQVTIPINLGSIREISVSNPKGIHKKPDSARHNLGPPLLKKSVILPAMLIGTGFGGSAFFGSHLQRQNNFAPPVSHVSKVLTAPKPAKSMPRSAPVRLIIPKIAIDTNLTQVGLNSKGVMEMPWDIEKAAWYKYSPTPGQIGPSIIVGHLDGANYAKLTGIFWKLRNLAPGDQIKVYRADGSLAKFKVITVKNVSQKNFPTQEIYGNIRYAGLRVITCGGKFDSATGHYEQNTVVFAALE